MSILKEINQNILWGMPMLIFMLIVGIFLTIATKGVIFFKFGKIIKYTVGSLFKNKNVGSGKKISPFAAVSTALAATVGTGNIVGVAIAIRTGGPGAVFWMWISALFGMVIKYSEVTLAVYFREKSDTGEYIGGPMFYISKGLNSRILACVFCFFAILSSFGIGNAVQANSLAGGLQAAFGTPAWVSGIILSLLCGCVLIGGIKRISSVAQFLVPAMALFYILSACAVIIVNFKNLPDTFLLIFRSAFSYTAPLGGFIGAGIGYAARIGVSRGLFTNEAGLGSAPIAHASADTDHPVRQGMWGAFEVFFDTIVMCSITALVILTTDTWLLPSSVSENSLTHLAFSSVLPFGSAAVNIGIVLFAFASIIAWYYYGEKCIEYLLGKKAIPFYRVIYVSVCFFGCVSGVHAIWEISDTLNALMAIPNLISLIFLAPVVVKLTNNFFKNTK